MTVINLV